MRLSCACEFSIFGFAYIMPMTHRLLMLVALIAGIILMAWAVSNLVRKRPDA
jgi:hypothetical protein